MSLESRLEKEIKAIENDDSLTQAEKNIKIRELERDAYKYFRELAIQKYRDKMNYYEYPDDYSFKSQILNK